MTDTTDDGTAENAARIFGREPQQQEQQQPIETDNTLRDQLAARYLISDEDRDALLTATDPDLLEAQARRLFARTPHNVAPREGRNPEVQHDPLADFTRELFTGNRDH